MDRDEVLKLVREHLAEELEVDPEKITETTRFKEDLDADSLDLYELVMELEDRYGIKVSEQDAARIETVGDAVAFVLDASPSLILFLGSGRQTTRQRRTLARASKISGDHECE